MPGATPLPKTGEVFLDARGEGRALRVSRHHEAPFVVISLWKAGVCTGTFRLRDHDLPVLLAALTALSVGNVAGTEDQPPGGAEPFPEPFRTFPPDRKVFPVTDEHRLPPAP